jgi:ribulose-phosphate 3-epimerase
MEIIPAIMPKSFDDIREHVERVFEYVDYVQLDLMDGEFVGAKTWPFFDKDKQSARELMDGKIKLPYADRLKYEFDLMVRNPETDLRKYVSLGASRLIIHANSVGDRELLISEISKLKVEWGIAFLATDNVREWSDAIEKSDFVQLMGIENIGYQGQPFDPRTLDQVLHIKQLKPNAIISVDGGITLETAHDLVQIGVTRVVSGSIVFGANNPGVSIEDFKHISNV